MKEGLKDMENACVHSANTSKLSTSYIYDSFPHARRGRMGELVLTGSMCFMGKMRELANNFGNQIHSISDSDNCLGVGHNAQEQVWLKSQCGCVVLVE